MGKLRDGYDENFLGEGIQVPMPSVGLELFDDVLMSDDLRDKYIADYIHYSLVMSKSNRQAFFSAANLNQSKIKTVQGRTWFTDSRIGAKNQVGPEAYPKFNPWDKGHLTRRTAVTWGDKYLATRASNDSCSYANACLQHENFNEDEWRVPERAVEYFSKDKNNKICVFTGPVFTSADRWFTQRNLDLAVRIPSGFWKVIAYIAKETEKLECQAYIVYQDELALQDKRKKRDREKIEAYQVTITEVERLTGLEFPKPLFDSNPLFFFAREGGNDGPEGFIVPSLANIEEGVVFSRDEIESGKFDERKREFTESDFELVESLIDLG